jgi:chromosome segregation ATPase
LPTHNALSYERFAAAADELVASGTKTNRLSYRMLRDKVGGSNSTIEKYLRTYRASHPEPDLHATIPSDLLTAIQSAIARERTAVLGECAEQLAFEQKQKIELHADLSSAEDALERRDVDMAQLATDRDSARGQCAQLLEQVSTLREELTIVLQQAESAKRQADVAQSQLDVFKGSVEELREQTEARLSIMRSDLSAYTAQLKEANCHAKDAEVKLADARAHLEAERTANNALNERLAQAVDSLQSHQAQSVKAAVDAATVNALKQQLAVLQRENTTLQTLVRTLAAPRINQKEPAES